MDFSELLLEHANVAVVPGIAFGADDGTFKPTKQITRAEMATLMDRLSNQLNIQ